MQFGTIHLEIWSTTQPSVTFWTLKFCPCFFVFCTIHDTKFCYIPKASVCVKSVQVAGWWGLLLLSLGVSYTSCIRFLTNVSLNCWYDNVEPQEARIMRLLRSVRTRWWKNSLLVHFQVCLLMVLEFVMQLDLSTHQMCLLQDCSMVNFTAFT
jgi:hypothetical protein